MKSPKEPKPKPKPKPKVAVKKLSKIIKGSGESRKSQQYLVDQNEMVVKGGLKILPSEKPEYISNGKQSYSYIPPKKFTYKKLVRMFYKELLNIEAKKLQANAQAIAEEIAEEIIKKDVREKTTLAHYDRQKIKLIFNETVEKKINETVEKKIKNSLSNLKSYLKTVDKELLRKRLFNILYRANFGYIKDSIPIVRGAIVGGAIVRGGDPGPISLEYWDDEFVANIGIQDEVFLPLQNEIDLPLVQSSDSHSSSPIYRKEEEEEEEEESEMRRDIVYSQYFIFPWKEFLLKVFKYLYKYFKRPPPQITYTYETMKDKKNEIMTVIISSYSNDLEIQKKVMEDFKRYEYQEGRTLIYKSMFNRMTIDAEIKAYRESEMTVIETKRSARARSPTRSPNLAKTEKERLLTDFLYKYTPKGNGKYILEIDYQTIYTTGEDHITIQFDNTFDRKSILSNMLVLLRRFKYFTTFINLLDCVPRYNIELRPEYECNPYDRYAIYDMLVIANNMLKDVKLIDDRVRQFYTIKNLESMKAGDLKTWYQINKIPKRSSKKLIGIFHSSSQIDNAGIILLFLKLRDARTSGNLNIELSNEFINYGLQNEYFGFDNISKLIDFFKNLFEEMHPLPERMHWDYPNYEHSYPYTQTSYNKKMQEHARKKLEHEESQKREKEFDREYYNEIFKTDKIWQVKLLRQRLNRIFYFLAKKHKINQFYLYTCPHNSRYDDLFRDEEIAIDKNIEELFSIPFEVVIDWRHKFNDTELNLHQEWVDGIL